MATADQNQIEQSEIARFFGSTVAQQANSSASRWSSSDSAAVGVKLFGELTDSEGKQVTLTAEQESVVKRAFEAKKLQMSALEGVAAQCGAQLTEEVRGLLETILDPNAFQQDLIGLKRKEPTRKKKVSLKALIGAGTSG